MKIYIYQLRLVNRLLDSTKGVGFLSTETDNNLFFQWLFNLDNSTSPTIKATSFHSNWGLMYGKWSYQHITVLNMEVTMTLKRKQIKGLINKVTNWMKKCMEEYNTLTITCLMTKTRTETKIHTEWKNAPLQACKLTPHFLQLWQFFFKGIDNRKYLIQVASGGDKAKGCLHQWWCHGWRKRRGSGYVKPPYGKSYQSWYLCCVTGFFFMNMTYLTVWGYFDSSLPCDYLVFCLLVTLSHRTIKGVIDKDMSGDYIFSDIYFQYFLDPVVVSKVGDGGGG